MNNAPRRGLGAINAVYWLLLSLWFGSLAMSGITAAVIFPMMKTLAPQLPEYAAYTGEHWRIAAGMVMARVFFAGDAIALMAVAGMGLITILHFVVYKLPAARPANALRSIIMVVLLIAVSYQLFMLAPRMNVNLVEYHKAALAGDNDRASQFEAAFSADHPRAENLLTGNLMGLFVVILCSAFALTDAPAPSRVLRSSQYKSDDDRDDPPTRIRLEEPALLMQR